ncbi:MAG: ATP-binding protein [Lachnospiraceae bacterium]|nr:ATP-binding protein [Lachnospiraceae bacterium]
MLGGTFLVAVLRNCMSAGLMLFFFLMLDRPKLSMKKTVFCYIGYYLMIVISFSMWYFFDAASFVKFAAFLSIVFICIFCTFMSGDGIYLSLYKISISFYLFSVCISCGLDVARWLFDSNVWADILVRFIMILLILFVTFCRVRKPFLEGVDFLIEEMDSFIISLIFITTYSGTVMAYWPNMQEFSIFNVSRTIYIFSIVGVFQYAVFRMYVHLGREHYYKGEKELLEMNEQLLTNQLEIMRKSEEEASRVRHDIRHHCLLMEEYIRNNDMEKLLAYLKQYREDIESTQVKRICRHVAAGSILSVYESRAKENGIAVTMDIKLGKSIPIRDIDLVAILANVFENAIHGCIHSDAEQKEIKINIDQKGNKVVIQFINTCAKDIKFHNGMPISKYGSGIGVKSIMKAVSNYHGETDFEVSDGMFITRILMNYPTKSPNYPKDNN